MVPSVRSLCSALETYCHSTLMAILVHGRIDSGSYEAADDPVGASVKRVPNVAIRMLYCTQTVLTGFSV
jgi:hypothetical protein